MPDRRNFLKVALAAGTTSALTACNMVKEDDTDQAVAAATENITLPKGIIYTRENPGKWAKKVGGHVPIVTVDGNKVTITTKHGMSKKHFIVRHTIVTAEGEVIAEKTFTPNDDEPISTFEIALSNTELFATSFCNKHDLWLTTFSV